MDLASVEIEEQQTRIGQLVRNELLQTMTGDGSAYFLRMKFVSRDRFKSNLPGTVTSRYEFVLDGQFELLSGKERGKATSGRSTSTAEYDIVRQPVADRQARDNASERAAIQFANDIELRISVYLSKFGSKR